MRTFLLTLSQQQQHCFSSNQSLVSLFTFGCQINRSQSTNFEFLRFLWNDFDFEKCWSRTFCSWKSKKSNKRKDLCHRLTQDLFLHDSPRKIIKSQIFAYLGIAWIQGSCRFCSLKLSVPSQRSEIVLLPHAAKRSKPEKFLRKISFQSQNVQLAQISARSKVQPLHSKLTVKRFMTGWFRG